MTLHITHLKPKTLLITALVFVTLGFAGWQLSEQRADAADLRNFDPGNIISDAVMSNKDSMTEAQIQAFLDSKNPCNNTNVHMAAWYPSYRYNIKDGKFVCMAKESFNGESAAHIIYRAAQDYHINPQTLIVLLQKEQGLITDTWPNHQQYRTATGYGCPDTAPCDTQYYGLKNQVRLAAAMFRSVLDGGRSNYPVGNNFVLYHPNRACGGTTVNIKNRATSVLYRYTPYQPNQSALNAGYGTGDNCGAYGNRNFWAYFTDWFGSTINVGADAISMKHSEMGGQNSWLRAATSDVRPTTTNGLYQTFEQGAIYWHQNTGGAWTVRNGAVGNRYAATNQYRGYLGYPRSDENPIRKDGVQTGIWQVFEGGQMYWSSENGAWDIRYGSMFNRYRELGFENSYLGYPKSAEIRTGSGVYQQFTGGRLYWTPEKPKIAIDMSASILEAYEGLNHLGNPTTGTQCGIKNNGCWQMFDGGKIYWSPNSGAYDVRFGAMNNKYSSLRYENGALGYPTSKEIPTGTTCGAHKDVRQEFQGGTLYWSACANPSVSLVLK